MRFRDLAHDFADIAKSELVETSSEDGDTNYTVVLTISSGKKIRMGVVTEQAAAADCLRRVRQLTAPP